MTEERLMLDGEVSNAEKAFQDEDTRRKDHCVVNVQEVCSHCISKAQNGSKGYNFSSSFIVYSSAFTGGSIGIGRVIILIWVLVKPSTLPRMELDANMKRLRNVDSPPSRLRTTGEGFTSFGPRKRIAHKAPLAHSCPPGSVSKLSCGLHARPVSNIHC
jgi:hypothetical protein